MVLMVLAGLAQAQDPSAEVARLESEMESLSQRNAWAGVDRAYLEAIDVGIPLDNDIHWLGVQAALAAGRMLTAWYRIDRMTLDPAEPGAEPTDYDRARSEVGQIEQRYGLVAISVSEGRVAALTRAEMPFAQRERDAIGYAREVVRVDRAYRGLLPVGDYRVDTATFSVTADRTWQVVVVE